MAEPKRMVFIDGTNLLIQLAKEVDGKFRADNPPLSALKLASLYINSSFPFHYTNLIRRYWFASYQGTSQDEVRLAKWLRDLGFEPVLINKRKNGREKGVDISLTISMLTNAFNQNYDEGILISGDEDYLNLVSEAKRYGAKIYGLFFDHGLSELLELSFDYFTFLKIEVSTKKRTMEKYIEELKSELLVK